MILASYGNVALVLAASNSVLYKAEFFLFKEVCPRHFEICIPVQGSSWMQLKYYNNQKQH